MARRSPRIDYVKEVLVGMAWGVGFAVMSEFIAWVKEMVTGKPQVAPVFAYIR